jgi:molecular chaperone Hsp33
MMMNQGNYMVRATALGDRVRAFALNATGVVSELRDRHDTGPVVAAALGRTAMGALLMAAASLKEADQVLTVEVKGDGPVGKILVTATGGGDVRGLVGNPRADEALPALGRPDGKLDVRGVVGTEGFLSVTRNLGMRDNYQGMVELRSGEIGDDLAYYLFQSEQTPSAVGVGVLATPDNLIDTAGGYLVQLLPGLSDDEIAAIERRIAALPHPTALLRQGVTPEGILALIFPEGFKELDRYPVRFHCPCSRERFEVGIISLGAEEITRIIEEEEAPYTEVVCHFCNERYRFSPDEMREILNSAR